MVSCSKPGKRNDFLSGKNYLARWSEAPDSVLRKKSKPAQPAIDSGAALNWNPSALEPIGLPLIDDTSGFLSSASFQHPDHMVPSAWRRHAPFAFWLIETHRPSVLVELGTHHGFAYLCFCQQIARLRLDTRCVAVDCWEGDEHAGFYGSEVLEELRAYHDPRYAKFSALRQESFDEALSEFADGSIDLLHIDGRHLYEDVRHDFESWRPKLSSRAIALFHDTQVYDRGFGVHKYWQEISGAFPHFEFLHGHGLGVLGVGDSYLEGGFPLFAHASDPGLTARIRNAYETLGEIVETRGSLGRNLPCPCGSGKRFKHCHGALTLSAAARRAV